MKFFLRYKNKKIKVNLKTCNLFGMFRGLMFRRREKAPMLLLFNFKKSLRMKIHSYFVFFDFVAVWLDDKNNVLEIKKVKPFRFLVLPKKPFNKLIEIPFSKRYEKIIKILNK